jgi:hypothetical protein
MGLFLFIPLRRRKGEELRPHVPHGKLFYQKLQVASPDIIGNQTLCREVTKFQDYFSPQKMAEKNNPDTLLSQ